MHYIIVFLISFSITSLSIPYLIKLLNNVGVVDAPGDRKIHLYSIPRMGGLIIYLATLITVFIFYQDISKIKFFLLSSFFFLSCGIIDDWFDINWKKKFFFQTIGSILLTIYFALSVQVIEIFKFEIPFFLGLLLLTFFILGFVNSINLMDGLDGLVSGYSIIVSALFLFLSVNRHSEFHIIFSLALLASLISFSKYNSYPAKLFLGDTGALILGCFLCFMSLEIKSIYGNASVLDLSFSFLIFGVPLVDTLKVMIIRVISRKPIFIGDNNHLHHSLFELGIKHRNVVFLIHLFSILYILNAVYYIKYQSVVSIILFFVISIIQINIVKLLFLIKPQYFTLYKFTQKMLTYPKAIIKIYQKQILSASILFFFLLIIRLNNSFYQIDTNLNIYFIISLSLLFALSLLHRKKMKLTVGLFVFLNFFFITFVNSYYSSNHFHFIDLDILQNNTVAVLLIIPIFIAVIIFFISRDQLISTDIEFFHGYDLILVVLCSVLLLLAQVFGYNINLINATIAPSLVIYFWFKLLNYFFPKIAQIIYFALFGINFFILLGSYFIG